MAHAPTRFFFLFKLCSSKHFIFRPGPMRVQKHVLHPQFNILYPLNNKNKVQGGRYSQIHRLCGHLHFSCVQQHNVQKD